MKLSTLLKEPGILTNKDSKLIIKTSDDPVESSHIVMVPKDEDDETPQAYVLRARIEGFEIMALCGHIFIPQQNPEDKPVCERCLVIYHQPGKNREDRNNLPDA